MSPQAPPVPEEAVEFLRRVREGLEQGLDPTRASRAAAGSLPGPVREALERMTLRLQGEYHEDVWGFDEGFAEAAYPLFEFLYERWWRVETVGADRVPAHGRALLVGNHAGVLPFDATMITVGLMKEHALPRWPRPMVLNWAFGLPWASVLVRKLGGVPANPENAERLLAGDELAMVFPEGVKGTGKRFAERYRLQRFGRGGFVEVALRTGAPIVPVAVVGSEEIYPVLARPRVLAALTGAPYVPVTPTFPLLGPLGLIPLPSRWRIEFCEPIELGDYPAGAADDRALVFELTERVRDTIQERLYANLVERGPAFV